MVSFDFTFIVTYTLAIDKTAIRYKALNTKQLPGSAECNYLRVKTSIPF